MKYLCFPSEGIQALKMSGKAFLADSRVAWNVFWRAKDEIYTWDFLLRPLEQSSGIRVTFARHSFLVWFGEVKFHFDCLQASHEWATFHGKCTSACLIHEIHRLIWRWQVDLHDPKYQRSDASYCMICRFSKFSSKRCLQREMPFLSSKPKMCLAMQKLFWHSSMLTYWIAFSKTLGIKRWPTGQITLRETSKCLIFSFKMLHTNPLLFFFFSFTWMKLVYISMQMTFLRVQVSNNSGELFETDILCASQSIIL